MNYDNFKELVYTRQACRNFSDKKVDKQTVYQIADLARFSPSACNSQPWKMCLVTSENKVKDVTDAITENGRNAFLQNVSAYIAVAEKPRALKPDITKRFEDDFFVKYDIGELIAYITLTAKTLGVESCVIGYVNAEKIKGVLDLEEGEECRLVVALGYSDIPIREKVRRDKQEVIKEF